MNKYLIIAGMFMISAVSAPTILEKFIEKQDTAKVQRQAVETQNSSGTQVVKKPIDASFTKGRTQIIEGTSNGHFVFEARLNNRREEVLIDTGATYVALNNSTARRMGINLNKSDFKYEVATANGRKLVALAEIAEIKVGRITVYNVQATVTQNDLLETVLLGMSFLQKLDRFTIEDNTLYLKQ